MKYGLNLKSSGALDFLSLGALVHRLDPGIIPFRKATHCDIHVSGGEFNVSANLVRLLPPQHRHRQRDGGLSDWRSDRRARPRNGRQAVLQKVQARRRARAEHGHGLFRPWPGRARAGGVLQSQQRSRRPAQAGRFQLERNFRRGRALVPQRRHFRRAVRNDRRTHRRGDESRQGQWRSHVVRFELSPETLGHLGRPVQGARCAGPHRATRGCARRQRGRFAERSRHRRPGRGKQIQT